MPRTMGAHERLLLSITGVVEAATGLSLIVMPSLLVEVLLGAAPDAVIGLTVARVAGAAVLALAVACWQARNDVEGKAAKGMVTAMLLYNLAVVAILALAWLRHGISGIAFWPVIAGHLTLAVWCVACKSA